MYTYKELFIDKIYGELIESRKNNDHPEILKISINLTDYCNYNCNYCIADVPNKINKQNIKKEYIKFFFDYIKRKHISDIKFRVNLLGGEPTLYKDIDFVIDSILYNYPDTILKLVTNGSASIDYYEKMINKYNIRLNISYHPEFADDEHFIDILQMLNKNSYNNYEILILLDYDYYDKIISFVNKLNNYEYNIGVNYIVLAGIDYNNTKFSIFNDLISSKNNIYGLELYRLTFEKKVINLSYKDISSFNSNNINIFKGMKCYINHWTIYNNKIKLLCSKSEYKLLPNDINKFLQEYNDNKNGIICDINKCDCDCLIGPHKIKNE